jgi:hypothetical protein
MWRMLRFRRGQVCRQIRIERFAGCDQTSFSDQSAQLKGRIEKQTGRKRYYIDNYDHLGDLCLNAGADQLKLCGFRGWLELVDGRMENHIFLKILAGCAAPTA